jgi:hypothetical protein
VSRPEENPRNYLEELLRERGMRAEDYVRIDDRRVGEQTFQATATVTLPDGEEVSASGEVTHGAKWTRLQACQALLDQLRASHSHLFEPWDDILADARAGDALIKLAVYLEQRGATSAEVSQLLQSLESNARLAEIYDSWKRSNAPELRDWGTHLSEHRKGSLVEAIIWRRLGASILSDGAREGLRSLIQILVAST